MAAWGYKVTNHETDELKNQNTIHCQFQHSSLLLFTVFTVYVQTVILSTRLVDAHVKCAVEVKRHCRYENHC